MNPVGGKKVLSKRPLLLVPECLLKMCASCGVYTEDKCRLRSVCQKHAAAPCGEF